MVDGNTFSSQAEKKTFYGEWEKSHPSVSIEAWNEWYLYLYYNKGGYLGTTLTHKSTVSKAMNRRERKYRSNPSLGILFTCLACGTQQQLKKMDWIENINVFY